MGWGFWESFQEKKKKESNRLEEWEAPELLSSKY